MFSADPSLNEFWLCRMPRTPSSTPPRSPGTPISDRSLSPPPLKSQQPAISSPIQNGIAAPRNVRQTPTPPPSPRRAGSAPRRAHSPRHASRQSPQQQHPPDPNLVDTSRPPPMRQQPPVPHQVTHFILIVRLLVLETQNMSKCMSMEDQNDALACLTTFFSASGSSAASSPTRPLPPSPCPPPTLLPPATHQSC